MASTSGGFLFQESLNIRNLGSNARFNLLGERFKGFYGDCDPAASAIGPPDARDASIQQHYCRQHPTTLDARRVGAVLDQVTRPMAEDIRVERG